MSLKRKNSNVFLKHNVKKINTGNTENELCILFLIINKIRMYEPGLVRIIQYFMNSYTFNTDNELQYAVNLWCDPETKEEALMKYGHISDWDVSKISNMVALFKEKREFNDNINRWNVSNVQQMDCMFYLSLNFNQPLKFWDVSNVKSMYAMFRYAKKFNQDITEWDVSKVDNMDIMFNWTNEFNQDISKWNVLNTCSVSSTFLNSKNFDYKYVEKWTVKPTKGLFSL